MEASVATRTTENPGPIGQPRGLGFGILLYIITFGLYGLWWVWNTQEEVKRHSGHGVGGWVGIIIYIVIGFVTPFLIPSEINRMLRQDGEADPPVSGWTGLWWIPGFIIIVGPFIWWFKVQGRLNDYWRSKGAV